MKKKEPITNSFQLSLFNQDLNKKSIKKAKNIVKTKNGQTLIIVEDKHSDITQHLNWMGRFLYRQLLKFNPDYLEELREEGTLLNRMIEVSERAMERANQEIRKMQINYFKENSKGVGFEQNYTMSMEIKNRILIELYQNHGVW